jgi:ferredoxin-NADP reductase
MKQTEEWRDARVAEVQTIARNVRRVTFEVPGPVPAPDPGSHLALQVRIGGAFAVRSYTCVPCAPGQLAIAVKLHPKSRGGSRHVWGLAPGDPVRLRMPQNHFALSWTAPDYVLLAGGIGITPMVGMAQALAGRGARVALHYGAEDADAMAYRAELAALLGDRAMFYSDALGQRPDFGAIIAGLHPEALAYVCGPLPMLDAVRRAWAAARRPVSRLRYEVFGDTGAHPEQAFEVEVLGLGRKVAVPADGTLLGALQEAGIDMIHDCRRGECGLCAVTVLSADSAIDHRDVFFSDAEKAGGRHMCSCVSRLVGGAAVIDIGYRA